MMRVWKKIKTWQYTAFLIGSLFLLSALILALTLIFFNPYDQSWMYHRSQVVPITNFLGVFGAQLSAFFFYTFGVSCWLLVFFLGYVAYLLFFKVRFALVWDRLCAHVILLYASAGLFHVHQFDFFAGITPGGVVGGAGHQFLVGLFDPLGAVLFLYAALFVSLIVMFPAGAIRVLRALGMAARFVCSKEKFLRPASVVTKKIAYGLWVPVAWSALFVRKLFGGADITESGESVVSFEQQLVNEVEREDLKDDPFWSELLGKPTYGSQKKDVSLEPAKTLDEQLSIAGAAQDYKQEHATLSESVSQPGAVRTEDQEGVDREYRLPDYDLFRGPDNAENDGQVMTELEKRAKILEEKLERFGVYGSVVSIKRGPVVTLFEYQPQIDSKISKIIALEDDLALALRALSIRIIAPIPGTSVVGFEVANMSRKNVLLSSVVHSLTFKRFSGTIPLVLGKDTIGNDVLVDLAKMPHLLIAGSTGSGKSVALNAFLVSMLCKLTPDELKLILIDPKRLEFAAYADIPHLLFPIVTDPKRTAPVLRWVVNQMEERYEKMATVGARNLFDYNAHVTDSLPSIVIVIDELSDLMMTTGKDIEDLIARIAQMARAAGIHMIVATQRPSVDVITGLIKVNFPSRISFRVTSRVDSRTILDRGGAEKLLGFGDMLFLDSRSSTLQRLHGAYVSNQEIEDLANHVRAERAVEYLDLSAELMSSNVPDADDELYDDVLDFLGTVDEVSISLLQRKFRIGYNRSARIIDILESRGVILPSGGSKMRKVIR